MKNIERIWGALTEAGFLPSTRMTLFHALSVFVLTLLLLSFSAKVFAINKCVDSAGRISYSDKPCESGSKGARIKTIITVEPKPAPSPVRDAEKDGAMSREEIKERAKAIARGGNSTVDDQNLTNKTINNYKYRASFTQALAAIGPFKAQAAIYAGETGHFPQDVSDIGFTRDDMRTSSFFSDLRFGTNGEILVLGNVTLGVDTVIKLEPRFTLGGTSIEWRCTTNADMVDGSLCDHDKSVTF
jgi:hypothetical protein